MRARIVYRCGVYETYEFTQLEDGSYQVWWICPLDSSSRSRTFPTLGRALWWAQEEDRS